MNCCWCRLQEPFTDASSLLNAAFKLDLVLKRNGFLFWELKALSYYKTPIHKEIDTTLFLYASKHYAQHAPVDALGKTCSMYHVRRCFDRGWKKQGLDHWWSSYRNVINSLAQQMHSDASLSFDFHYGSKNPVFKSVLTSTCAFAQ